MAKKNSNETVFLQVVEGEIVEYDGHVYGSRATLQVKRSDVGRVNGKVEELRSGDDVPDVADRH